MNARQRMLRRFAKVGTRGFYVVRSTEGTRVGTIKRQPSRFRPARSVPTGQEASDAEEA